MGLIFSDEIFKLFIYTPELRAGNVSFGTIDRSLPHQPIEGCNNFLKDGIL
jgi:hypothetical protein